MREDDNVDIDDPKRIARRITLDVLRESAARDDAVGEASRAELQHRVRVAREQWGKLVAGAKTVMEQFADTIRRSVGALCLTTSELAEFEKAAQKPMQSFDLAAWQREMSERIDSGDELVRDGRGRLVWRSVFDET